MTLTKELTVHIGRVNVNDLLRANLEFSEPHAGPEVMKTIGLDDHKGNQAKTAWYLVNNIYLPTPWEIYISENPLAVTYVNEDYGI